MHKMTRMGALMALVASVSVAACGGGGDDTTSAAPTPAPAPAPAPTSTPASTATRPQLSDTQALDYTVAKYLAQAGSLTGAGGAGLTTDNWLPPAIGDVSSFTATYTVAADGSGTHTTLQAAIDAVPLASASSTRVYIRVTPGTYRELVCAKDKAPITLYSTSSDASAVTIVSGNYNGKAKTANVESANPCNANLSGATFGTSGSASVAIYSHDFHAKNVSFANDAMNAVSAGTGYPAGASGSGGAQAVALMTQADRLVFENVRLLGHQDTLYVKSPNVTTVSRAYFKNSYIQGDVDFIFGRGVLVLDACQIHYLSTRLPTAQATTMIAPSTASNSNYGILVNASQLTADSGTSVSTIYLGRAWDEGVTSGNYVAGMSPNGQLLIRNSTLGAHVRTEAPWGGSTSGRAYSETGNRFSEHRNTVAP
jgi:pectinesterase